MLQRYCEVRSLWLAFGSMTNIKGRGGYVGHTASNSPKLAPRHPFPIPEITRPHRTALVPPEGRARLREAERAVQELRIANERPRIELCIQHQHNSQSSILSRPEPTVSSVSASSAVVLLNFSKHREKTTIAAQQFRWRQQTRATSS